MPRRSPPRYRTGARLGQKGIFGSFLAASQRMFGLNIRRTRTREEGGSQFEVSEMFSLRRTNEYGARRRKK